MSMKSNCLFSYVIRYVLYGASWYHLLRMDQTAKLHILCVCVYLCMCVMSTEHTYPMIMLPGV